MNDDELTTALRAAMGQRTAADAPSQELVHALATTRVRGPRPYLVPLSVAATVTALATGGAIVSQAGGGLLSAGASPSPDGAPSQPPTATASAAPTPSASASTAALPSAPAGAPSTSPSLSAEPTASAAPPSAPTTTPPTTTAPATTTGPTTTAPPIHTAPAATPLPPDDGTLLTSAASYSVTAVFVRDAAHPGGRTTNVETYPHDSSKTFYAGRDGLDWDQLAALPKDQTAFAATVLAPGQPSNAVEKGLQDLYMEGPIPYDLRKEVVAVLQTAPGATTIEHAADHLGRPATRVRVITDLVVDDYYFDPVSYRLLEAGVTITEAWKAHYLATEPAGALPLSDFSTGYTSYSDWIITPKTS